MSPLIQGLNYRSACEWDANLHFFHSNFTTPIYDQNLHNYLILARLRDVMGRVTV